MHFLSGLKNIYNLNRIKTDRSSFSRKRSEALKGFLMLLIILGHNSLLMVLSPAWKNYLFTIIFIRSMCMLFSYCRFYTGRKIHMGKHT